MENREKEIREDYAGLVNNNTILLSFEGWIKYIEGFTRGLSTTKTVDSASVLDCIGEILEYMQQLRGNLFKLLSFCEKTLEQNELLQQENTKLKQELDRARKQLETRKDEKDNGESL